MHKQREDVKYRFLGTRLTPAEHEVIRGATETWGVSMSWILREGALRLARRMRSTETLAFMKDLKS